MLDNCPRTATVVAAIEKTWAALPNSSKAEWFAHLLVDFEMPKAGTVIVKHCYDRLHWRPEIKGPLVRKSAVGKSSDEVFIALTVRTPEDKGYTEHTSLCGSYEILHTEFTSFYDALTLGDIASSDIVAFALDLFYHLLRSSGFKVAITKACIDGDDSWFKAKLWDGSNEVIIKIHAGNLHRAAMAAFNRDPNDDK